jgi:hypothetical protein
VTLSEFEIVVELSAAKQQDPSIDTLLAVLSIEMTTLDREKQLASIRMYLDTSIAHPWPLVNAQSFTRKPSLPSPAGQLLNPQIL